MRQSKSLEREREIEGKYQNREVALFFNLSVCSFLYPLLCSLSLSLSLSLNTSLQAREVEVEQKWEDSLTAMFQITKQSMSELPFFIMTSDPRNSYSSDINALRTGLFFFSLYYYVLLFLNKFYRNMFLLLDTAGLIHLDNMYSLGFNHDTCSAHDFLYFMSFIGLMVVYLLNFSFYPTQCLIIWATQTLSSIN